MRKITFIIILLTGFIVFSGCTKKEKLLVKSWRYEKLESKIMDEQIAMEKERIKTVPDSLKGELERRLHDFEQMMTVDMKKSTMDFKQDGTFSSDNLGEKSDGKWSFTKDKKILVLNTDLGGGNTITDSLEIITLDEKQLKLKSRKEGDDGILTLVPKDATK